MLESRLSSQTTGGSSPFIFTDYRRDCLNNYEKKTQKPDMVW